MMNECILLNEELGMTQQIYNVVKYKQGLLSLFVRAEECDDKKSGERMGKVSFVRL